MSNFDYHAAFARNLGWVTPEEQEVLRGKRVAIAGLGGVGGSHLLTLTRLGIGAFHLADLDAFELANFNRQAGAFLSSLGRPKVDVLAEMALDINPELRVRKFPAGVDGANMEEFFAGVDLYVDGLDFFAVSTRRAAFAACARRGIPAVTAAPLGMGAAVLNFLPGRMSFDEYFDLEGRTEDEQLVRFLVGLSPAMLQLRYLVYPGAVDFTEQRGPSTPMACEICAGLAATEALKILLGRGRVLAAPVGLQYDAYRNRLARTWRPGGNRNPVQRVAIAVASRQLGRFRSAEEMSVEEGASSPIRRVLDLARWAPSGDNSQPWRFEIEDDQRAVVHGFDTREHCVYDLRGRASQLAIGALLETASIAATKFGFRAEFTRRTNAPDAQPTFEMELVPDPNTRQHVLLPYIPLRATQRRRMRVRRLTQNEKRTLANAVGPAFSVLWCERAVDRLRMARLMATNGALRLTLPEAYEVHRSIIEWGARFSNDRIPDRAVGLDPIASRLSRWALTDWKRMAFLNRYLGGTLLPRAQLDFIPALACAAHVLIVAETAPRTLDDWIAAGRAVQRFWLTVTRLDLWQQPEMTPLIFSSYLRENIEFTRKAASKRRAKRVAGFLADLFGSTAIERAIWLGRIGSGPPPKSRSLRLPLEQLMMTPGGKPTGCDAQSPRAALRRPESVAQNE